MSTLSSSHPSGFSFGPKSNLPDNFDPFIGSRKSRLTLEAVSDSHLSVVSPPVELASSVSVSDSHLSVVSPPIDSSSQLVSDSVISPPTISVPEQVNSALSAPISRSASEFSSILDPIATPPPTIVVRQPAMSVGTFPSLNSVHEIREFDGSPDKLIDFLTSVEAHISAYDLPIYHGGYVSGNVDEGWMYATAAQYRAAPMEYKSNYNLGRRFCTLLVIGLYSSLGFDPSDQTLCLLAR